MLLCSPDYVGTHSVDQAGLKLVQRSACFCLQALGLNECATIPGCVYLIDSDSTIRIFVFTFIIIYFLMKTLKCVFLYTCAYMCHHICDKDPIIWIYVQMSLCLPCARTLYVCTNLPNNIFLWMFSCPLHMAVCVCVEIIRIDTFIKTLQKSSMRDIFSCNKRNFFINFTEHIH